MKNRKRTLRLGIKTVLFIAIILVVAVGTTIITSFFNHSWHVDDYFKNETTEIARKVSKLVDGDFLEELLAAVKTPEYAAIRDEAEANDDEQLIEDWLKENGFWEKYVETRDFLAQLRDDLGVRYLYVESDAERDTTLYLVDPDETYYYTGLVEESEKEFSHLVGDIHIDPVVSNGAYGWICSAYEPVLNSEGKAVASVGADLDMREVMAERYSFLRRMILFGCLFILLFSVISIFLIRRAVTAPLEKLTKGLRGFAPTDDGDYKKSHVLELRLNKRDEIGELCDDVETMQRRIVDTLHNLTTVTAERERIGAELNVATQIQEDMLPKIYPMFTDRDDIMLAASMKPAKEVGGDFYDFFLVDEDHLAMVMADVSGKGVPAALFMVIAKTLIKNRALRGDEPSDILTNVNAQLCEGNEAELFVTVWLGILNLSTGQGVAANAGHEHPVIRRVGSEHELVVYRHSPALATMEDLTFRQHSFEMHPGDTLFVYTDGVPEATNSENEMLGTDRMLEALNRDPDATPGELLDNVMDCINGFMQGAPQFDDITMLALKYLGREGSKIDELNVEAKLDNLDEVLAFIDTRLEEIECPMKTQMQIDVAVEELFVNIANYAYTPEVGPATIQFSLDDDPRRARITFIDHGIPYNPLEKADPDITLSVEERAIGGLGIYMVKKSMDDMQYEYKDSQNILTIWKAV